MKPDLAYLPLLAEESAEVIQIIMKMQRFGNDEVYLGQDYTNLRRLCHEVGDLLEVLDHLDLNELWIQEGRESKKKKLLTYGPHVWGGRLCD